MEDEKTEAQDTEVLPFSAPAQGELPDTDEHTCPNPQCRYDKHADGANFCLLCGTLLYTHCEDCLANNPQYARFCYYCGSDLDELRENAQLDQE